MEKIHAEVHPAVDSESLTHNIESHNDWVCVIVKRLACMKCSFSLSLYFLLPKILSVGFLQLLLQTQ